MVYGDPSGALNIIYNSINTEYLWFAIPSDIPSKLVWYVDNQNSGDIGGTHNLFDTETIMTIRIPETLLDKSYKIYMTNYSTEVASLYVAETLDKYLINMPIDFNDNLQIRAPKPIDDRYGPWETIEEGLINVPYPYRYDKLTLNINGVEYWFKEGLEDLDLIVKEYGGVSVDASKWESGITLVPGSILHGRLYNWYAIKDIRGLAPEGWHVPTFEEFITLRDFVGEEKCSWWQIKRNWICTLKLTK